jgi:hypothetical protein
MHVQPREPQSVLQVWVQCLTFMQQSVLISCIRSPDGLHKNHVAKLLLRWLRRCVLLSAFDGLVLHNPYSPGGGSFTGPSMAVEVENWHPNMNEVVTRYLQRIDETPLHFHLHFMHASQIIGFKHPNPYIRDWWHTTYNRIVHDMHLTPETESAMNTRLGDTYEGWNARNDPAERAHGPRHVVE